MAYDGYVGIPQDLRPNTFDAVALTEIAFNVKEAVKIRHDFLTAIHHSDVSTSLQKAFLPAILQQNNPNNPRSERHLGPPKPWESYFAQSYRASAKTIPGLAAEHLRLKFETKSYAEKIKGNQKLGQLVRSQLDAFFPDIGYSPASGNFLRRLRKDERSILDIFKPLGVEDDANIIRLLTKRKPGAYYYW